MDHAAYCDVLEAEAERFVEAVRGVDPGLPVPTCPEWSLADLMRHLGGVHRWASHHVAVGARARVSYKEIGITPPEESERLADWVEAGIEPMVQTFRASDPDAPVWGWGADRHARFWPRRMVYETVVHGADATIAVSGETAIDSAVAADGIDELLSNLPQAAYFAPRLDQLRGDGETIGLRSTDSDDSWTVRLVPAGFAWDWSAITCDVTVDGSNGDLLLLVYGRLPATDPERFVRYGDEELLDRFIAGASL
jgi:uncharacterized protein (TIGR03083 family)